MGNLCVAVSQQGIGYALAHTARAWPPCTVHIVWDNALAMAKALTHIAADEKSLCTKYS